MSHKVQLKLSPKAASDYSNIILECAKSLRCNSSQIKDYKILKRSIDARSRTIWVNLQVLVIKLGEEFPVEEKGFEAGPIKSKEKSCIIVGFGPAGMFAALRLIEMGIKPIVLERGRCVKDRRRDLALMNKEHIVNNDSNYCFGEGGAGTFSDGKLYTRSKKRGDIQKVLKVFVEHGADPNIAFEANPHIGTNKLPAIVEDIRNSILEYGGEVHFEKKVIDFILVKNKIKMVVCGDGSEYEAQNVILATGHSARDIFELMDKKKLEIEAKPFALGVRIEHPQELIDSIQYRCDVRSEHLPPANYKLVSQQRGRGVFSFCMCPGGIIAPASTSPGEVVVNGWSPSKRNGKYANSGMVVSVGEKDFEPFKEFGELRAMKYQEQVEKVAFQTNMDLTAPAQRVMDFIKNKESRSLENTSYIPGVKSRDLREVLPKDVSLALREGLVTFGKKMRGYTSEMGMLVGVESRTSSPVRIPRDKESLLHTECTNLYPCGEGAGYAGGIMSAALDGIACAEKVGVSS
jgi:uncharacterized FAD-dependent dehydrogenase